MACVVLCDLFLIEDIPNNDPDPRYNFLGLMFERDTRIYADAEARRCRCNARARYHEEDEGTSMTAECTKTSPGDCLKLLKKKQEMRRHSEHWE
jgi:hypothetical protein